MPAQLKLNRLTGPTGTVVYTEVTDARARGAVSDDPVPGNDNPIPPPNPGQVTHSYWMSFQLETIVAPDTLLNNVRIYTDGAISWPGVELKIALASAYVEAIGTEGVSGTLLNTTNHASLLFEPVPLQNYTASSPLVMSASTSTAEKFGEIIVLQITGTNQAVTGKLPPEVLQFVWDEA